MHKWLKSYSRTSDRDLSGAKSWNYAGGRALTRRFFSLILMVFACGVAVSAAFAESAAPASMKPMPMMPASNSQPTPATSDQGVCPEPGYDDTQLKWKFAIEIDAVYENNNVAAQNFGAGVQAGLDYLNDQIGTNYSKNCVFAGFDLMVVSELWHNTPPARPPIAVQFETRSVGETSGPDITKLYPATGEYQQPNPWAQVPEGDRQISTQDFEVQEIYSIFIVAYIKPHTVRFFFGELTWRTWLHRSSGQRPELHFVRQWDEEEIRDFSWKTPFQAEYSRTVAQMEGRVSASRTLAFKISDDGYGCRFSTSAQAQKQDSRSRFMGEWIVDPSHRAVTWHTLYFLIIIANPTAKEVTVGFDYTQSISEPPDLGPPLGDDPSSDFDLWVATTDLMQAIAEADDSKSLVDIYRENTIGIYKRYDTSGSKAFKFRDKQIVLYVYWNPAGLDLHKKWLHRLSYSASSKATLDITVSGLKGR